MPNYFEKYRKPEEERRREFAPFRQYREETPEPEMPTMGEFATTQLKSAPESAWGEVKNLASALWSPIDTGRAALELGEGLAKKGFRALGEIKHGAPYQGDRGDEIAADVYLEGMQERHGSPERFVNTMMTDPFGGLADISGVRSLIKPTGRGAPLDTAGMAGKAGQKMLRETDAPRRLYQRGAGVPETMLDEGADMARGSMRAGYGTSTAGMRHIDRVLKEVGGQIDEIVVDATRRGGMNIPKDSLVKYLDSMISQNQKSLSLDDLRTLYKLRGDFKKQFRNDTTLTPKQVQEWKLARYDEAWAGRASPDPQVARGAKTKGQRQMGRGARAELENRLPDLADLNVDYATAAQIRPFIQRRIDSLSQGDPNLAKSAARLINLPKVQGRLAIILDRVANGDMGWLERNFNTSEIRTIMALAGRYEQALEEETEIR